MIRKNKQKIDKYAVLIDLLRKEPLSKDSFIQLGAGACGSLGLSFDISVIENWQALGLDISETDGHIVLNTATRNLENQCFCVVDIETTGSIRDGQIIEIGAIKLKGGEQIDSFSSLVFAPQVPDVIRELTGISTSMLCGAPTLSNVLPRFRDFLADSVFVAHNVNFDYNFISQSMVRLGLLPLLNRKLCTVELSRRIIASKRYALDALKELLNIENTHHRAYSDAISAACLLNHALARLPQNVKNAEELIHFSKNAPSLQLPKDDEEEVVEYIEF